VLTGARIRHTVSFSLNHDPESIGEEEFLAAAERLREIPGVEAFEIVREVSPKNDFRFGISMEFVDQAAYDSYNAHPEHRSFVEERWLQEVSDFLEIDYAAGEPGNALRG
jgi:quinol monooxygenase YgiN